MGLNFRTIAKFCFLLVIIGFLMPICCDQNGFELANSDVVKPELTVALYALFISAIVGVIIGVILLMKKGIPVVIDWLVILVCVLCGLIPFFININQYKFQAGLYVIVTGYALILITQIVSLVKKET
ncbi:MAG: hypothetical protein LBU16_04930 [Treponema sp.]|jgi:hypothetical protein|nr:hypothetical protein [Treponema sp.]